MMEFGKKVLVIDEYFEQLKNFFTKKKKSHKFYDLDKDSDNFDRDEDGSVSGRNIVKWKRKTTMTTKKHVSVGDDPLGARSTTNKNNPTMIQQ